MASRYVIGISPSFVIESVLFCLRNYLACQGVMIPLTVIAAVKAVTMPAANYVTMTLLAMGIDGACIAYLVANVVSLLLIVCAIWLLGSRWQAPSQRTWARWSASTNPIGFAQYLRVSLPSMALICANWWVDGVLVLMVGHHHDGHRFGPSLSNQVDR